MAVWLLGQGCRRTHFDDLPICEDDYHICCADRTQAVGNGDDRALLGKYFECLAEALLTHRVDMGSRFIEDDQPWMAQKQRVRWPAIVVLPEIILVHHRRGTYRVGLATWRTIRPTRRRSVRL